MAGLIKLRSQSTFYNFLVKYMMKLFLFLIARNITAMALVMRCHIRKTMS